MRSRGVLCRLRALPRVSVSCAQMSTSAASRTGAAARSAPTSRAASTAPATAATRSARTAGPATVRPVLRPLPALHFPSAPPTLCLCSCQSQPDGQIAEVAVRLLRSQSAVPLQRLWGGREEGGGTPSRAHVRACQGHGELPQPPAQDDSPGSVDRPAPLRSGWGGSSTHLCDHSPGRGLDSGAGPGADEASDAHPAHFPGAPHPDLPRKSAGCGQPGCRG